MIRIWLSVIALITAAGCSPFQAEVNNLMSETGAKYSISGCSGGVRERRMSCDIDIAPSEVDRLAEGLGLNAPIPGADRGTHVVYVMEQQQMDESALKKTIDRALGHQLWSPSRHGFAGALLLYDPSKRRARLWLSIAYG